MHSFSKKIAHNLATNGYTAVHVFDNETGNCFTYTIGLYKNYGHPELIAVGLPAQTTDSFFETLAGRIKQGETISIGTPHHDLIRSNLPIYFLPVAPVHYPDYLIQATHYNQTEDYPCLQLLWPDSAGKMPWEPTFDPRFAQLQTLLVTTDSLTDLLSRENAPVDDVLNQAQSTGQ